MLSPSFLAPVPDPLELRRLAGNFVIAQGGGPSTSDLFSGKSFLIEESTGNVGIGMTNPSNKLHVSGSIGATGWIGAGCEGACSSDAYAISYADGRINTYSGSGSVCSKSGGSATFSCSSDRRLKDQIKDFTGGLSEILRLRPRTYVWKNDEEEKINYGFIAQEVREVIPHAVSDHEYEDGKTYLSLDQGAFTPYLINAVSDLNDKVESKGRSIASLEKENQILREENQRQQEEIDQLKQAVCSINPALKVCQ